MKIGIFIDTYFPMVDGVIIVVDNYARQLSKTDDVTVFCPAVDKKVKLDLPYKVVRCNCIPLIGTDYKIPTPTFSPEFRRALKNSDLDIVHIHSPFFIGKAGLKYAKKHNIPAVATIHSQYDKDVLKAVRNSKPLFNIEWKSIMKVFNSVDKCFAVNAKIGERFIGELGLKKDCSVLRNASSIKPVSDKKAAYNLVNDTFHIKEGQIVYLFVGRIDLIKNLKFTIDALSIVKRAGIDFRMMFVGDGHDKDKLAAYAKEKGIEENVIFTGRVRDVDLLAAIYARAKLMLFPSLYDANSLVQLEAAGQSTPTVFLREAITASTTIDGVNAFHADDSVQAFADKIIEIEKDDALYEKVSEGAKRDLYLTWAEAVKEVKKEYETIISSKKSGDN